MRTNRGSTEIWRVVLAACISVVVTLTGCAKGADSGRDSDTKVADAEPREPAPPPMRQMVVPEGTKIAFRLTTDVSSQTSSVGERVNGVVTEPIVIGDTTVIPVGSIVRGEVTVARPLPKIGGRSSLAFELDELETPDGRHYPIAATFARTGPSETAKDTATIVAGVVIGAVAGHQVDDDQGRGVGAVAGGGIGTAIAASTDGQKILLPQGTQLKLTIRMPVPVQVGA